MNQSITGESARSGQESIHPDRMIAQTSIRPKAKRALLQSIFSPPSRRPPCECFPNVSSDLNARPSGKACRHCPHRTDKSRRLAKVTFLTKALQAC
jgi:hypothetical protein